MEMKVYSGRFELIGANFLRRQLQYHRYGDDGSWFILAFLGIQFVDIPIVLTDPTIAKASQDAVEKVHDEIAGHRDFCDGNLYLIESKEGHFRIFAGALIEKKKR